VRHGKSVQVKKWISILLAGLLLVLVTIYFAVPQVQPCALLSRVLPSFLLPPNPNVADLAFAPLPDAHAVVG
jgi:hypothetical protein